MIATGKECVAFRDYLAPLHILEDAFRSAGEKIEFRLKINKRQERSVEILHNGKVVNTKFIEGGSPARTVKDIAVAVPV
jgi:hypothetical protein